ncbi:MinD/ParA family ATP-binding protein [Natrarchaeobius oligotrophus]|uniref:MinD/ParA family protein n=1 Tax=Natrarchaeobius chitinivorans TaxID=1679083 RepID=A0A3N6MHC3_NATCH|nr:MinD/ParA family protein [Natrarchaeobius chitinivorans]RQH03439.1 MinD/ParA family protein [Natrarchaeobius chitinivorans]
MIVAVGGGKGGVGKSTVATNLAREFGAVLVDADLSTPDLPRGTGPGLQEVLAGRTAPADALERRGSFRLLPCERTLSGVRASDRSALGRTLRRLERECDRVVVDCPAGLARDVGTVLARSDLVALVTTPSRPALLDAVRTRRLALELETPIGVVVLNRSRDGRGEAIAAAVESRFEAPVAVVPERPAIDDARRTQQALRDVSPDDDAVESFESIARTIRGCERRPAGSAALVRSRE